MNAWFPLDFPGGHMSKVRSIRVLAVMGSALMATASVQAQTSMSLEQENQRLRQQIQAMQQAGCNAPSPDASLWNDAHLAARVTSIRLSQKCSDCHRTAVTIAIEIRNNGSTPLALNYEARSFSLTDNHGYMYQLLENDQLRGVKGIPVATGKRADTRQPLMPGQSSTVTFLAERSMKDGQTPGSHFDINVTFGAYQDQGQGRIQKLRTFPVAFTNVSGATAPSLPPSPASPLQGQGEAAINHLINGFFNGRKP